LTEGEIEKLIRLNKSDFEYREWLPLKYAQDWALSDGEEPRGDYVGDYQSHYSEEQRGYIHKIMRMMRFTNRLGNTLTPASPGSGPGGTSAVCVIENKEYLRRKETAKEKKDQVGVLAPPPLIFGILLVAGLLLHRHFPLSVLPHPCTLSKVIGNLFFVVSALIMVPTTLLMLRKKTALTHHKATTSIVTNGFFRYSRNPLYLSLLLIFSGIAVHANSLWLFFLLPVFLAVLDRGVVLREERHLEREFGEEYLQYKKKVRRALAIPQNLRVAAVESIRFVQTKRYVR
jgi:protein-S-isoprenylcysteine O-methyltransferase Ste14